MAVISKLQGGLAVIFIYLLYFLNQIILFGISVYFIIHGLRNASERKKKAMILIVAGFAGILYVVSNIVQAGIF